MALPPMKKVLPSAKKLPASTKRVLPKAAPIQATSTPKPVINDQGAKLKATMQKMATAVLGADPEKEGLDLDSQLVDFKIKLDQMEALLNTPDVPIEEFKQGFILLKRHLLDVPQLGAELSEKEIGVISGAAWALVDKGQVAAIKTAGAKKSKASKPSKYTMANSMKKPDTDTDNDLSNLLF